jgi:hypothetical protein
MVNIVSLCCPKYTFTLQAPVLLLHYEIDGAGIVQLYSAGLWDERSGVRIPAGAGNLSLYHCVQAGSGAHPASYQMDNGLFPWR